jgi:MSHA pilin protein MshA
MQKSKGFTLVELVIVIVILGILAVTAAPKFLNLAGDAKKGTLDAVKASLQSANSVIYSKAVLQGKQKVASANVNESGTNIAVVYGYVAGTQAAVQAVLDLDGNFTVAQGVAIANAPVALATSDVMIYPANSDVPTSATTEATACFLKYTPAANATSKPTYALYGNGC